MPPTPHRLYRSLQLQPWRAQRRLAVPQFGEQVVAQCCPRGVAPQVLPLQRILSEVIKLALSAVMHSAVLVRRQHPLVTRNRADMDVDTEQLAVPLGEDTT